MYVYRNMHNLFYEIPIKRKIYVFERLFGMTWPQAVFLIYSQ